jgi:hypothetical protein
MNKNKTKLTSTNVETQRYCNICGADWNDGDIKETFVKQGYSEDEAIKIASDYGWTVEKPISFSRIIGIEDSRIYDGISYYQCPDCFATWDRWHGYKYLGQFENFKDIPKTSRYHKTE